jgi:hypothetical protein
MQKFKKDEEKKKEEEKQQARLKNEQTLKQHNAPKNNIMHQDQSLLEI